MNEKEIAVLFAAGKGSRLLPLTEQIPKPLIKVKGKPMIETLIEAYQQHGIKEIHIVVGYKKEQFAYLTQKYQNVFLTENKEYLTKNNISSFYAIKEKLGDCSAFLCDADLYVNKTDFLSKERKNTCFIGKYIPGETTEWVFKIKDGRMTELRQGGCDDYNLVGISYWKKDDLTALKEEVIRAYQKPGHENLFWEEIANLLMDQCTITVMPIEKDNIYEIDTIRELIDMDPSYTEEDSKNQN